MKRPNPLLRALCVSAVYFLSLASLAAQGDYDIKANYVKSEHMVPMRDGIKLFTIVYSPKDQAHPYPFLLHRTPYSSPPYGLENYRRTLGPSAGFAREGYLFVYQDVRGKFRSEGDFVVMRPI